MQFPHSIQDSPSLRTRSLADNWEQNSMTAAETHAKSIDKAVIFNHIQQCLAMAMGQTTSPSARQVSTAHGPLAGLEQRLQEMNRMQELLMADVHAAQLDLSAREKDMNFLMLDNHALQENVMKHERLYRRVVEIRHTIFAVLEQISKLRAFVKIPKPTTEEKPLVHLLKAIVEKKMCSTEVGVLAKDVGQIEILQTVSKDVYKSLEEISGLKMAIYQLRHNNIDEGLRDVINFRLLIVKILKSYQSFDDSKRMVDLISRVERLSSKQFGAGVPDLTCFHLAISKINSSISRLRGHWDSKIKSLVDEKHKNEHMQRKIDALTIAMSKNAKEDSCLLLENTDLRARLQAADAAAKELRAENEELRRENKGLKKESEELILRYQVLKDQNSESLAKRKTDTSPAAKESKVCRISTDKDIGSNAGENHEAALVAFSGIKDDSLAATLDSFNVKVHTGKEFSDSITHVISPEGGLTLRVLAASITGKWIMNPSWILASKKLGSLAPETEHGVRYNEHPFRGRSFHLTPAFLQQNSKHQLDLGKGRFVKNRNEAQFVISADHEARTEKVIYFKEFLAMIPAVKYSQARK